MRNLFDQYNQPENRLNHALLISLDEDRALLSRFIKWATGKPAPASASRLQVLEQTLPGEEELQEQDESERRGLPDGCIHDENGWALLIESKVASSLDQRQLRSHRRSAGNHGISSVNLLALVVEGKPIDDVVVKRWTDLYKWLKGQHRDSYWAKQLISYMEVLEAKLPNEGYLKKGALTVFTGIPFGRETPYSYREAKRLIRLAMDGLRVHEALRKDLGADLKRKGRTAIKGKDAAGVWDIFWLENAKAFTEVPHLNFSILNDRIEAMVIVPDKIGPRFRRRLLEGGWDAFQAVFAEVLECFDARFKNVDGAVPWVTVLQRHSLHRGAEPIVDAQLKFDLHTAFAGAKSVKPQHEWLRVAYDALSEKKSNIEFDVGVIFRYEQCPNLNSPEILNLISSAWLSCKPFVRKMIPED